jgi:hypothetical protein
MGKIFSFTISWFILSALLIIGITFGWLFLLKPAMDLQTHAYRSSYQYVNTKQNLMLNLITQYDDLESDIAATTNSDLIQAKRNQQIAIIDRIANEAALIPADQVPAVVTQFLHDRR